jgi:hypothetical protein
MKQFALLLLLVSVWGCKKPGDDARFFIPFRGLDFTIPAGVNPLEAQYFNINDVPTNTLTFLDGNGMDLDEVTSILPVNASITSIFGDANYDFAFEISINICEAGVTDPNCGREAFWRQPVPENIGTFVELNANTSDIQDLLKEEKINIQIKIGQLRGTTTQFVESRLEMDFAVY